jgi:hypothetical protein
MFVEGIYKDALGLIRENWDTKRTILVIGKEKAFLAMDLEGADIAGGYDVVAEYGTALPIDPNMRRESIMLMWDKFIAAGLSAKQLLSYMKLNDVEGIHDRNEMAADRQREIFEEMEARFKKAMEDGTDYQEAYIQPADLQDHAGRLEYAYDYLESSEFKYLEEELQELIKQHVREREELAAAKAVPPTPGDVPGQPAAQSAAPAAIPPPPPVAVA